MAVDSTPSEEQVVERGVKNKEELVMRMALGIIFVVLFGICLLASFYKPLEKVLNGVEFAVIVLIYTEYVDRLWLKSIMASLPSVDDQDTTQVNGVENKLDKNLNKFRMILHPVIAFLYAFSSNANKGPLNYLRALFVVMAGFGLIIYCIQVFISTCCRSEQTPPEVEIDYEANAALNDIKIDYGKIRWFLSSTVVLLVIVLVTAIYKPLEEVNKGLGNIGQQTAVVLYIFYFFEFQIEICKCGFWGYKWNLRSLDYIF